MEDPSPARRSELPKTRRDISFREQFLKVRELRIQLTLRLWPIAGPTDEAPPGGTLFAPDQGRGKLHAIGRPQGMRIQQLRRQITNLIAGKNFPPPTV